MPSMHPSPDHLVQTALASLGEPGTGPAFDQQDIVAALTVEGEEILVYAESAQVDSAITATNLALSQLPFGLLDLQAARAFVVVVSTQTSAGQHHTLNTVLSLLRSHAPTDVHSVGSVITRAAAAGQMQVALWVRTQVLPVSGRDRKPPAA